MIPKIFNTTRAIFNTFLGAPSDNRLAFRADVNNVIDYVNASFGYRQYVLKITQSGTSDPVRKYMTSGAVDNCKKSCTSDCVLCDCKSCNNEITNAVLRFVRNDVGIYTFTLAFSDPLYLASIGDISLWFTPPAGTSNIISVVPNGVDPVTGIWSFSVKTVSSPGALADGILNNVFAQVHVYTY